MADANDMYERAYHDIQEVLDVALGPDEESGAGAGIAADVRLLAQRYADLKLAVLDADSTRWAPTIAEIEASPLRCIHGVSVDDDCRTCLADVMAQTQTKPSKPA